MLCISSSDRAFGKKWHFLDSWVEGRKNFVEFALMSRSWFVPACQHLVSHVSLPHVFTLHPSSVIELCSYWLGGTWAGMRHSWNWQSFHVSKGETQWDISKHVEALGFKWKNCQVHLRTDWCACVSLQQVCLSVCVLSARNSFIPYLPFLCLVLLFQFWID